MQVTAAATTTIVETVEEASSSCACPSKPKAKIETSTENGKEFIQEEVLT
jgi:hypothetical protein